MVCTLRIRISRFLSLAVPAQTARLNSDGMHGSISVNFPQPPELAMELVFAPRHGHSSATSAWGPATWVFWPSPRVNAGESVFNDLID